MCIVDYTAVQSTKLASSRREQVIFAIITIKKVEIYIQVRATVVETGINIAVHLVKQVKIIHKLVICIASTTLHEDRPVCICMRIDCPGCPLPTDVTRECNKHPPPRRLGEERKW